MEDAESLAQSAVERLSEDETLRGDLTDDGFSPLLDWAANAAIAYAQGLQSNKAEEAMDAYATRLKGVMQEVVAAAKAGKIDDPAPLLDFQMGQPEATKAKLSNLELAPGEDDANAIKIAEVLSEALSAPAQPAPPEDKPAPPARAETQATPVAASQPATSESATATPSDEHNAQPAKKESLHELGQKSSGKSGEQHNGQQERADRIQAPPKSEQHPLRTPEYNKARPDQGKPKN